MDKIFYDVKDIMQMFNVKQTKAYKLIKQIKNCKDTLKMNGRILKTDFEYWTQNKQKD